MHLATRKTNTQDKMVKLPILTRRRATIDAPENAEVVCSEVAKKTGKDAKKLRPKIKNPFKSRSKGGEGVEVVPETVVILSFEENLHQNRLTEASRQLITREDVIFSQNTGEDVDDGRANERDQLQMDYEMFQVRLWMVIHETFLDKCGEGDLTTLRSAVTSIMQEEEQDRRWQEPAEGQEVPDWRPRQCLMNHNNLLQKIVDARINKAEEEESGADKLSTALKRQVCKIGKRVQGDLLKVVKDVKQCYPTEFNICRTYTRLYHQAFSRRLGEFAQTSLDVEDCSYLLLWVNSYYPMDVLKHKELKGHIDSDSLGPLLSVEDIKPLEQQYLSFKEAKVRDWLGNALKTEEERWLRGDWPELIDEYYMSLIAVDVIGLVTPNASEAQTILGDKVKAQILLCLLEGFLASYKKALEDFTNKGHHDTTKAVLKANLVSIEQFREFIEKGETIFKEETRRSCLSILGNLRDFCHSYFLCPIHKELKVHYRKLWTTPWFEAKQGVPAELLGLLDGQAYEFRDLKPVCREELLGQLHFEVMVNYVKRLLKRKMKLRDREQQEAAASLLCEDSRKLNTLFTKMGSKNSWLKNVLDKLAEVIRLQDPGAIQLEMVTLAREHPDLSKRHIGAILHLKAHLSAGDVRQIRESLTENRDSSSVSPLPAFFAKVLVK